MKRIISVILLLTLCCTLLAGCHGKQVIVSDDIAAQTPSADDVYQIPDSFDTSRNYEISFWAKNDTNMTQVEIYKQAIADFESLYPNITVNLRLYTDYGKIYNDVITNIATDTTPNVCITYPDHIATYMTGEGTVVPLDELIAHPQYGLGGSQLHFDGPGKEEIIPKFINEGVIAGVQYAIPYMRSTEACYVNKTFVEKLGYELPEVLTWDFVWEVSEAAMEKDADGNFLVNGQNVLIPFLYKSTDNMMIQWLYQQDAPYSNENGDVLLFSEITQQFLSTIAQHADTGAFSTFKINGYPANFLNAGQCIFAVDSTAGATWMGSDAPLIDIAEEKLVQFETVILPIPQVDPSNPKMISQGPSMCVFNKDDPQEVLASWLFAQYMLTNDVQIAYSQTEGYLPVTSKAQQSDVYQDYLSRMGEDNDMYYPIKIQASKLLMDNIDRTFVTPVFNGSASVRDAAGQLIENTTKSVRRGENVSGYYFSALYADIISLHRLDQVASSTKAEDLGPLPVPAVILLSILILCWVCIGAYVAAQKIKQKKAEKARWKD